MDRVLVVLSVFPVETAAETSTGIHVMLLGPVEPVWQRRLGNPGMFRPDVVRNKVKKNLHSLLVRLRDEFLIVPNRSKMWIDRVESTAP